MSNFQFSFEKLEVYKDSRLMTGSLYTLTAQYPDQEKYGLVSQMRRAAISICSNIAEGSSRTSKKDQAHYYQIAYGSLLELLNQSIISNDLGFIKEEDYLMIRQQTEKIANKLNALRKSCLSG
jgi:four helix bundle protein